MCTRTIVDLGIPTLKCPSEREGEVNADTDRAETGRTQTQDAWMQTSRLHKSIVGDHAQRVKEIAIAVARALGVGPDAAAALHVGAYYHDIGKTCIPCSILQKPGPLNPSEWNLIRKHPLFGANHLRQLHSVPMLRTIAEYHHEKWDGTGYPYGLQGETIPLAARIVAIADVWDALCSNRPYRLAWTPEAAHMYICQQSGYHFDPLLVAVFESLYNPDSPVPSPASGIFSLEKLRLLLVLMQSHQSTARILIVRRDGGHASLHVVRGELIRVKAFTGPSIYTSQPPRRTLSPLDHWNKARYWIALHGATSETQSQAPGLSARILQKILDNGSRHNPQTD